MATQVQFRRGTTAETASFTGASGEITVDLTKHVCVVHDAIQVGGYPMMLESGANSALSLGTLSNCSLKFLNDPNTGFFSPGPDQLTLVTGGVARIAVDSAGAVSIPGNLNNANITTANITTAKVTTLADSLGTNTSTPAAIAAGIAKAWVNFNGTSNSNNLSGTYSRTLTTVAVTATAHGLIAGNAVYLDFTSGDAVDGTFTVTAVIDANNFEVTHGTSGSTSGDVTIRRNPIRAAYNVSSITDNGTGDYTVNFTTAMVDADYVLVGSAKRGSSNQSLHVSNSSTAPATGSCRIITGQFAFLSANLFDGDFVHVAIFR